MTLPRLYAMQYEEEQHPPVHHLLAAFMGHKPPAKREKQNSLELGFLAGLPGVNVKRK